MSKREPYEGMVYAVMGCIVRVESVARGRVYLHNQRSDERWSVPVDVWQCGTLPCVYEWPGNATCAGGVS